jgi:hypothetical protein
VLQGLLVALALLVTVVRCWVRLRIEHRKLTLPDYLVWGAWLCSLGWFVCSATALHILIKQPLVDQNSDSVAYLVVRNFMFPAFQYGSHVAFLDSLHWILLLRHWTLLSEGFNIVVLLVAHTYWISTSASRFVRRHHIHSMRLPLVILNGHLNRQSDLEQLVSLHCELWFSASTDHALLGLLLVRSIHCGTLSLL